MFYVESPQILSQKTYRINEFETGTLKCEVSGYPRVVFKWQFGSKPGKVKLLQERDSIGRFSVSRTTYDSESEYGESRFYVSNLRQRDWGLYKCIAENEAGYAEKNISLEGQGRLSIFISYLLII